MTVGQMHTRATTERERFEQGFGNLQSAHAVDDDRLLGGLAVQHLGARPPVADGHRTIHRLRHHRIVGHDDSGQAKLLVERPQQAQDLARRDGI